jgi:hypothetical protein
MSMIVGRLIGAACRWFDIPLPVPTKTGGGSPFCSITVSYIATHKLIGTGLSTNRPAIMQDLCGGPAGEVISRNCF